MVTTNSKMFYEKLYRLRTHSISREEKHQSAHPTKPSYYEKLELGNLYRMADFQAAPEGSQLKKIRAFHMAREKVADLHTKQLRRVSLDLPWVTKGARSSWHLYPLCVQGGEKLRNKVMGRLHRAGVMANLHYLPVPQFQFYKKRMAG